MKFYASFCKAFVLFGGLEWCKHSTTTRYPEGFLDETYVFLDEKDLQSCRKHQNCSIFDILSDILLRIVW